jgi:dipeptidyl aminopeptidase/acylaminoacyl peptidase
MMNPLKQVAANRTGLCLAIVAVLFVGGWRLSIIACQPAHWLAFATELGSVAQKGVTQTGNVLPNKDGDRLIYERETETGLGTFYWDAATGRSKLLIEEHQTDKDDWRTRTLGWSPDESMFACVVPTNMDPGMGTEEIVLYNGNNGDVAARIPADGYGWYSQFAWLSPRSFAYSLQNQYLAVFEEQSTGAWIQSHFYEKSIAGPKWQGLKALTPQSVVWQEGRAVWTFDFTSATSTKLWKAETNTTLESFSVTEDGNLSLRCKGKQGRDWVLFAPPGKSADPKGTVLSVTPDDKHIRRADMHELDGVYSFTIRTNLDAIPVLFSWEGKVERWKLAGATLFFSGNRPNEPSGVWLYDVASDKASCLTPTLKRNSRYGTIVTPLSATTTNALGKRLHYRVWEPVQMSPGAKYPLILGESHNVWSSFEQVPPNEGYYFATVDRPSWNEGIGDWEGDVLCVYEILVRNPRIDTNRVSLLAISQETAYLSEVVAERPDRWKSLILFNPAALPDPPNAHVSSMFIVDGKADGRAIERLTKYQDEAARVGIPVRLALIGNAGHIAKSMATEREQTRRLARFLVEN